MSGPATPVLTLILLGADIGWLGPTALGLCLATIGWLIWQLQRRQRSYAADLADQPEQVTDERRKAEQARREQEVLAGESLAKSEMLATLSREIRAHLNGVIGSADLMLESPLQPQQRDHLTTLRGSAESLVQSLNDV